MSREVTVMMGDTGGTFAIFADLLATAKLTVYSVFNHPQNFVFNHPQNLFAKRTLHENFKPRKFPYKLIVSIHMI